MSSTNTTPGAVFSYLRLDAENDFVLDSSVAFTNLAAVTQAIKTTMLLFQGEWWENLNAGVPMFQKIIGQSASASAQQTMAQILAAAITAVPYVSAVLDVTVNFNPATRQLGFTAIVQTSFGITTVTVTP